MSTLTRNILLWTNCWTRLSFFVCFSNFLPKTKMFRRSYKDILKKIPITIILRWQWSNLGKSIAAWRLVKMFFAEIWLETWNSKMLNIQSILTFLNFCLQTKYWFHIFSGFTMITTNTAKHFLNRHSDNMVHYN